MGVKTNAEQNFLSRLTEITEANLNNEQFGVAGLAHKMGMSRSYIHRRLKALTNQSISQFISTIRLNKAMEMLLENDSTAAEIAYEVGFSSPAYFNHCFHEHFGFPPGEVKKKHFSEDSNENEKPDESLIRPDLPKRGLIASAVGVNNLSWNKLFLFSALIVIVFSMVGLAYFYFIKGNRLDSVFNSKKELSIIVLPFKNLSDDPNNQWLADGFAEDILTSLCNITSLKVSSRTSAEQFRESTLSAPEIAKKMHVNYVLEGSVRWIGDELRITILLIDANSDKHLWSQNFDAENSDIIGIQGDIALQVANELNAVLSEDEIRQIKKNPTQNAVAYTNYLHARFLLHKANSAQRFGFDKNSVMSCIQYYEKAIAEDENFAEAYAGLASAWFQLTAWGWLPGGFLKASEISMKALQIDPENAEAHAILGALLVWGQRNFEEGGKELMLSVQLDPNFATSRQLYAQYLMITGPIGEARRQIDIALELEPYFWVVQNLNAWIYYFEEEHDKAIEACILAHDLKPDFIENEWLFFINYAKLGEGEKAMQMLQILARYFPDSSQYAEEVREAYDESGITGLFNWLIDVNMNNPISIEGLNGHPYYIAWWNAIIGNADESVYWLQKNMETQHRLYVYLNIIATNPDFDILHDDPRFLKIVDEIGLTPYLNRQSR